MKNKFIKMGILISVFISLFVMTSFYGCKKDNQPTTNIIKDVSFLLNPVTGGNGWLKSTNVTCTDLPIHYIKYKLGSDNFKVLSVFYINNIPFTTSTKLPVGSYILNEFLAYNNNNTPNDSTDDILVSATPHLGSEYASYASNGALAKTFEVTTDNKNDIKIDVVCFVPENFNNFGFAYFQIYELKVRQMWFFGDFCIKDKASYAGSLYSQQTNWGNGIGYADVPAIMKVEVYKNGTLQNTFTNSAQGEKLSVTYGDYKNYTDAFEVKLYILVKQGNSFVYNYFKSWFFNDISNIPSGTDGVTDFVLGDCYDSTNPPDLILAPWMNLPSTATYTITAWNPSNLGGYVDATITNVIPNGSYDFNNGIYASNCADHQVTINVGQSYNMDVYSSLYQDKLPIFAQSTKWNKINWLYNHLDWYPGYHWYDIQGFIWLYDNPIWNGQPESGMPALTAMSQQMKADADNYGSTYMPLPGGWAAIIFLPAGTPHNAATATIQTMTIRLDP